MSMTNDTAKSRNQLYKEIEALRQRNTYLESHRSTTQSPSNSLRANEKKYKALFDEALNPIFVADANGMYIDANAKALEFLECTRDDLIGKHSRHFTHQVHSDSEEVTHSSLVNRRALVTTYLIHGTVKTLLLNVVPTTVGNETILYGIGQDITERTKMEEALRLSEKRMELAIKCADLGTWDWSISTGNVRFNERWAEMLGYSLNDIIPHVDFWKNLIHPDDAQSFEKALAVHLDNHSSSYESEYRMHHKSNGWIWVMDKGRVVERDNEGLALRACGTSFDITLRKQSEEAINRAARMEATATLAGGIAHDFNNLMVGVLSGADLLGNNTSNDATANKLLGTIKSSAKKASDLAQMMLAYARGGKYLPQPLNLNDLLQEPMRQQDRAYPVRVRVECRVEPSLWNTIADRVQMTQVLMNLSINGIEAIEGQGRLVITTRNVVLDEASVRVHPGLTIGDHVCLSVEDTGCGISEENRARIFEPFFSTKRQGRGLGLAAVYGIIENHNGHIGVQSEKGRGTTFEVYLPATHIGKKRPSNIGALDLRGNETILIVDDDEMVQSMTKMILEQKGYRVLTADHGHEALEMCKGFDGNIDVALLDMGMPVMGGVETYSEMIQLRPRLKVIICSGYELDAAAQTLLDAGASAFIQKPFRTADLAREIRRTLEE